MHPIKAAETELHAIATALETEGHHLAARLRAAYDTLRANAPQLEHDAETDAAGVVKTAESRGLVSAEQEAAADAGALAAEAGSDLKQAATAQPTTPAPAAVPAEPTA